MVANTTRETVGTTAIRVTNRDKGRTSLALHNLDSANDVYYGFNSQLTTGNGFPVRPRQTFTFAPEFGDDPTLEYWMISAGSIDVAVSEQRLPEKKEEVE
jgi:hypothetical protein